MEPPVIVIGAGLAGLACARELVRTRVPVVLLEAEDTVGGRMRTDRVDGFLLDRGFQVFLTAYPEAREVLELGALGLRPFARGAQVFLGSRFHRMPDPFRQPIQALPALFNPVGTPKDKLRMLKLWRRARHGTVDELFGRDETTSFERLRQLGFSEVMIDCFFRPFFGGIFLERELITSSRMLEFVFRMMSEGEVALPAGGIGTVPKQLATQLPAGTLRLGIRVSRAERNAVVLEGGHRLHARAVVIATEAKDASALADGVQPLAALPVTCLYFSAPRAPFPGPHLLINGEPTGPVNHVAVLSEVAPSYASQRKALVSATVIGTYPQEVPLLSTVRFQLASWFGDEVDGWEHLRTYEIERALPDQRPPLPRPQPTRLPSGVFLCGDHLTHGSVQGALSSGRQVAGEVLRQLEQPLFESVEFGAHP